MKTTIRLLAVALAFSAVACAISVIGVHAQTPMITDNNGNTYPVLGGQCVNSVYIPNFGCTVGAGVGGPNGFQGSAVVPPSSRWGATTYGGSCVGGSAWVSGFGCTSGAGVP